MTTIAWDGMTLAADRCSWSGVARRRVKKVFKLTAQDGRKFLVAFTGSEAFAMAVLGWMRGEREKPTPRDFLREDELGNQCALVIDENRRIWQLGSNLTYTQMREKVYAFGGGQDFAWGAIEAGATAKRAIEIAIKRSDMAGLGVDCVRF